MRIKTYSTDQLKTQSCVVRTYQNWKILDRIEMDRLYRSYMSSGPDFSIHMARYIVAKKNVEIDEVLLEEAESRFIHMRNGEI